MKTQKVRIDALMAERGLVQSRQKAQALIMAGKVTVNGEVIDKAGAAIDPESDIFIKEGLPFVSRGGVKLKGALDEFKADVSGLVILDVGASTGGFTDCLLKRGAKKVYAIDVGKGLLDINLRNDPRVVVLEERNIRYLDPADIGEQADMAVIDVSFISLEKVLPKVKELIKSSGRILALIKPQFEVGKGKVGKGGIVKDPLLHKEVRDRIKDFSISLGFDVLGTAESPIKGSKGNIEFWICLGMKSLP